MKKLTIAVLATHSCILLWACFFSIPAPPPVKKKPVVVKTIALKSPPRPATRAAPAPVAKPASPQKKPPAPGISKPSIVKKKPSSPSIPPPLLKELEESIAKIEQKRDNLYRRKEITALEPLQLEEEDEHQVEGQSEMLVRFLHASLHLPDYGEVTIKLTLGAEGNVENYLVMKSESEKNKRYLEEKIPSLSFPLMGDISYTVVLTFCNEV